MSDTNDDEDNNSTDLTEIVEDIRSTVENMDVEDRLDDLEDKINQVSDYGSGSNDNPFGNPFNPLGGGDNPLGPFGSENPFQQSSETTQTSHHSEMSEDADEVTIQMDVPEFEPSQIDITADPERIRVRAEATDDMYHDTFSRVFDLPVEVQPEDADAEFENGFLTITVPRVDPDDQTTITIGD